MKRLLKRLLVLTIILMIPAGAAAGYWWARQSLPPMDGQIASPGLGAPVEVLVDQYGVPSIYARDAEDAFFSAGVLHARDRLWQMELYRRVTLGRLSEVLGDDTVEIDKRFLTLGLRDAARAEWERATPQVRMALEKYAAGVNAYVATLTERRQRPLEFQILGFMPAPWDPIDSLSIGRLLAWRLAENHHAELVRGVLARKFGPDSALLLTGRYPANGPAIVDPSRVAPPGTTTTIDSTGSMASTALAGEAAPRPRMKYPEGLEWLSATARRGNSNSWVLAARKTRAGRPMLANDPHLQIEFPSVWYEMHLVAADLDVAGVTIPGVPMIVIGHNARVAWGLTNTGADVQDLSLERVDLARQRSFYRGEWAPIEVIQAEIPVRGGSPVPFEVWKTRNGPIIAEVELDFESVPSWLSPADRPKEERRAYSLRWDAGGDIAVAFDGINRATDWESFAAAVNTFALPSQNIVYADVDGNIGYLMSGRVPTRAAGDGRVAVDGNTGPSWTGSINPASLPRVLNPDAGFIASANNLVDRSFSPLITNDWAAPFRALRLREMLTKAEGVDLDAMAVMQNDKRSAAADLLLAHVPGAIKLGRSREGEGEWATRLDQLAQWDRIVDDRAIVSYYQAFEDAVWRRAFVDEMEEPLFNAFYEWAGAEKYAGIYALLEDPDSKWWDDILTVERKETVYDVMLTAAQDAEFYLRNQWGGDSSRSWGRLHRAQFSHPIGNRFPFQFLFNEGPVAVDGDGTTVMRVSFDRLNRYDAYEYPSWRQLFDVGQWDDSRVILPTGQSGHPLSPFYFDQNEMWRTGQYRRQPFSRVAVTAATRYRLLLVP